MEGLPEKRKWRMLCGNLEMKERPELVGISGWLLVLCIVLTVIRPALLLLSDIRAHVVIAARLSQLPSQFLLAFAVAIVFDCYLVLFSILSGVALWRREKYAVRMAQMYFLSIPLIAYLGQQLFSPWKPSKAADPAWIAGVTAGPLLWFLYLQHSRRVHNTFSTIPRETTVAPALGTAQAEVAPVGTEIPLNIPEAPIPEEQKQNPA